MSRHWSKLVHDLEPYVPGEQPQDQRYVKLNTNESPYPPAPGVARCLAEFGADELRRYPDPGSGELVEALADYHGLPPDRVFVGNGSDEVLAHAFQALLKQERPILFPDISYSFYPVYCALYEIDYRQVPLDGHFRIDLDGYRADNGGIVIANPNAPTGIALGLAEIRQLLADNPESAVVVDEAYVDFGADSALPLIDEFDNLLVVRSFSKSRSLAGLRLGYALGQPDLIEGLQRVKNSFNSYPVDRLACRLGVASIDDEDYFRQCADRVIATRGRVAGELEKLGFTVFPSSANFLFARAPGGNAENLYLELKAAGVLVRYFARPRIDDCLRISIGSDDECGALIEALKKILA
ncbi:MAG TPA: histidinol-phosphate transaminase [Gammaproteobacteria bacterium]|nr:histidinol-phosphate transaminase [Gammaproteobacteria bacterium]